MDSTVTCAEDEDRLDLLLQQMDECSDDDDDDANDGKAMSSSEDEQVGALRASAPSLSSDSSTPSVGGLVGKRPTVTSSVKPAASLQVAVPSTIATKLLKSTETATSSDQHDGNDADANAALDDDSDDDAWALNFSSTDKSPSELLDEIALLKAKLVERDAMIKRLQMELSNAKRVRARVTSSSSAVSSSVSSSAPSSSSSSSVAAAASLSSASKLSSLSSERKTYRIGSDTTKSAAPQPTASSTKGTSATLPKTQTTDGARRSLSSYSTTKTSSTTSSSTPISSNGDSIHRPTTTATSLSSAIGKNVKRTAPTTPSTATTASTTATPNAPSSPPKKKLLMTAFMTPEEKEAALEKQCQAAPPERGHKQVVPDDMPVASARSATPHASSVSSAPSLEEFSRLRVSNRLISSSTFRSYIDGGSTKRQFVPLAKIRRFVAQAHGTQVTGTKRDPIVRTTDWVTVAVVASKSTKKGQYGSQYFHFRLNNLDGCELPFWGHGDVYKTHWRIVPGTVIALLNPEIIPAHEADKEPSLKIDHPAKLLEIGTAMDFGFCKSMCKNGSQCTNVINKGVSEVCTFHSTAHYKKLKATRPQAFRSTALDLGLKAGAVLPGRTIVDRSGGFGGRTGDSAAAMAAAQQSMGERKVNEIVKSRPGMPKGSGGSSGGRGSKQLSTHARAAAIATAQQNGVKLEVPGQTSGVASYTVAGRVVMDERETPESRERAATSGSSEQSKGKGAGKLKAKVIAEHLPMSRAVRTVLAASEAGREELKRREERDGMQYSMPLSMMRKLGYNPRTGIRPPDDDEVEKQKAEEEREMREREMEIGFEETHDSTKFSLSGRLEQTDASDEAVRARLAERIRQRGGVRRADPNALSLNAGGALKRGRTALEVEEEMERKRKRKERTGERGSRGGGDGFARSLPTLQTSLASRIGRRFVSPLPHAANFQAKTTPLLPKGTFDGKVALVTGGGTGLGLAMAQMISELGGKVAISSRRLDVISKSAEEVSAATGNPVLALQADVRSVEDVKNAVDRLEAEWGLPDIVINNAAGNFISPTERLSPNAFKTVVDIVLQGTANVTFDVGRRLIEKKKPATFLSITTTYARTGSAFVVPSACAKAGVEAMLKSLAVEWARYGMRFVGIAPGPIETEGAFSRLDPTGEFRKQMLANSAVGRLGESRELANLASYLVSDYASWCTGEIVTLDGGESVAMAGEFNQLRAVPDQMWDHIEKSIRSGKK